MEKQIESIDLKSLKLDLMNPRLPKSKQGKDEETVIEFMLLEAATLELMMAIGQNDYFAGELLLVIEDPEDAEKYVVIEGNRRLTAVKLLNDPSLSTVKKESIKQIISEANYFPKKIPSLIFNSKEEILKYLGFRHITGIKSWRLLEKARYLYDLKISEFNNVPFLVACRKIAKMIGSSSGYIRRLLTGLELYKKVEDEGFYKIENLNDTRFHLNYFVDALNKENIRNFLNVDYNDNNPLKNLNPDSLELITHWWFEKEEGKSRVLGNSQGLKLLNAVLGNEKALKAFKDEGISIYNAYELTSDTDILFKSEINKSVNSLERADALSNRVKEFYPNLLEDLKLIRDLTLKIRNFQRQKEEQEDEFS